MTGMSDFTAENYLNYAAGRIPFPATPSVFLALFTTAPTSDAGTGGTEVSGGAYARVQVAGQLAAGASWTTASTTITLGATAPAWLLALGTNGSGVNVYDTTNGKQIGTVSSVSGTTVTLTTTAANASQGATDTLAFSAFNAPSASSGAEPATTPASITNGAAIAFPQATASWGTVTAFGLYDAVTAGNLITWDYLGNFKWAPFTATNASPSVLTSTAHGYANGDSVVVTTKYGGTLPATAGSWAGLLTVANVTTDTFTAGVNTTGTGDGQVRKVASQLIPQNITASFPANNFTANAA